jgi:hypothetical protein
MDANHSHHGIDANSLAAAQIKNAALPPRFQLQNGEPYA